MAIPRCRDTLERSEAVVSSERPIAPSQTLCSCPCHHSEHIPVSILAAVDVAVVGNSSISCSGDPGASTGSSEFGYLFTVYSIDYEYAGTRDVAGRAPM